MPPRISAKPPGLPAADSLRKMPRRNRCAFSNNSTGSAKKHIRSSSTARRRPQINASMALRLQTDKAKGLSTRLELAKLKASQFPVPTPRAPLQPAGFAAYAASGSGGDLTTNRRRPCRICASLDLLHTISPMAEDNSSWTSILNDSSTASIPSSISVASDTSPVALSMSSISVPTKLSGASTNPVASASFLDKPLASSTSASALLSGNHFQSTAVAASIDFDGSDDTFMDESNDALERNDSAAKMKPNAERASSGDPTPTGAPLVQSIEAADVAGICREWFTKEFEPMQTRKNAALRARLEQVKAKNASLRGQMETAEKELAEDLKYLERADMYIEATERMLNV
ncbi:hypothetical protein B0H17DRAFT_1116929 [Mycena rosella]|uniref:Uncharacterized protein n=1 Tax=Mycena rosella TaxID=1033263 RepID=A0AAD7FDU3_MYCRO|nr:hypothetical protein B0H17DRAFT_1116929 [Mycena rosella]